MLLGRINSDATLHDTKIKETVKVDKLEKLSYRRCNSEFSSSITHVTHYRLTTTLAMQKIILGLVTVQVQSHHYLWLKDLWKNKEG